MYPPSNLVSGHGQQKLKNRHSLFYSAFEKEVPLACYDDADESPQACYMESNQDYVGLLENFSIIDEPW